MPTVCDILRKFEHRINGIDARLAAVEIRDCSGHGAFHGELWEVSNNQIAVWSAGTQKPLSWSQGEWARLRAGKIEARGDAFDFRSADTGARVVFDVNGLSLYEATGLVATLDDEGISITQGEGIPNRLKFVSGANRIAEVYAYDLENEVVGCHLTRGTSTSPRAAGVFRAYSYAGPSTWVEIQADALAANHFVKLWVNDLVRLRVLADYIRTEVQFQINAGVKMASGAVSGYVLTSDASGVGTWQVIPPTEPTAHDLVGIKHTASGLTVGHTLRASSATTFTWAQLQHTDLGAVGPDSHHAQLHAAAHVVGGGDALSVGVPVNIGTANAEGTATNFARRDHVHAHPSGLGADLHHARAHFMVSADHGAADLIVGYTIRATGATTFAWAQLQHADLGGVGASDHHTRYTNSEAVAAIEAATDLNLHFQGTKVYNSLAQSIPTATGTVLTYNTEEYDTKNWADLAVSNDRITVGKAGYYLVTGLVLFSSGWAADRVYVYIQISEVSNVCFVEQQKINTGGNPGLHLSTVLYLAANAYVRLIAYQNSGATRDTVGNFVHLTVTYLGD